MNLFEGLKVIDLTSNLAGPCTGMLLGDYGAEVIHIEKPVYGDDNLSYYPMLDGASITYSMYNRNKRSVVLDLKDPRAVEIVKKMARDADVLLESSRPGAMKRLGLDYEVIHEINPRLVYCSISAFGQTGPYARRPGYDIIAQAYSGIMHLTGEPDGDPTRVGTELGDYVGTLTAFGSICAALYHQARTGEGQQVDISLARALTWMSAAFFDYPYTGVVYGRTGNHNPGLCPYGVFNGNGGSIVIAAISRNLWEALCRLMGREELISDPRFNTNGKRVDNLKDVIEIIEGWLHTLPDIQSAEKLLNQAGIPNARIFNAEDVDKDIHANEAGWISEVPFSDDITSAKSCRILLSPSGFSAAKPQIKKAPLLGADNEEILSRYGYTPEEIRKMEAEWQENALKH